MNILQDFCDRGKSRHRDGILTFRVLSRCFRVTLLSFAEKSLAMRCMLILVFSSRLCTAFLVHSLLQVLILSSLTFPLPFPPDICPGFLRERLLPLLSSSPCSVSLSLAPVLFSFSQFIFQLCFYPPFLLNTSGSWSLFIHYPDSIIATCSVILLQSFPWNYPPCLLDALPPHQFFFFHFFQPSVFTWAHS